MVKKQLVFSGLVVGVIAMTIAAVYLTGWKNSAGLFPVSAVIREFCAPVQKAVAVGMAEFSDVFAYFSDNKALRQQNEILTQRVAQLEEEIHRLKEQEMENERLLQLLDYKEQRAANYSLVTARVIARDPGNSYQTVTIDQGRKAGLAPNMPVVNHQGLVGTVTSVTDNTAEVLLLFDTETAVGGRIFETRVTPGVVVGTGKSGFLEMIRLSHDVPLDIGQTVVTSGLGGIYPKGIRIGTVTEIKTETSGLTKTALIQPFVDFSRLEEVFVITNVKTPELEGASEIPEKTGEIKP